MISFDKTEGDNLSADFLNDKPEKNKNTLHDQYTVKVFCFC